MDSLTHLCSCVTALVIIVATDNVRAAIDADTNLMWIEQYSNDSCYMSIKPGDPISKPISNSTVNRVEKPSLGARSVTFDHKNATLYYNDVSMDTIMAARLGTFAFAKVHEGQGDSLQIALDWTVGNMYWVDGLFNWVAVKSLPKDDVYDFRVLVDKNVERPTGIAVDPRRGYLYWCEAGKTPKVQRSSMAGESPEVIVVDGLYVPRGMTIDPATGRIYWVDYVKETLELWDPSKRARQVLVRHKGADFVQSAFYKGSLFVTDSASKVINVFKDGTGDKQQEPRVLEGKPLGIAVYSAENQPSLPDPCTGLSCDHYCFAEKDNRTSGRCICQDGFELQSDGKTCSGSVVYGNKLFIFASPTGLHVLNITLFPRKYESVINGQDITAIAVDSNSRLVYFAERGSGKISSYSLRTAKVLTVTTCGDVAGMSYDWLSKTLYWTDSGSGSIQSYRVTSGVKSVVLQNSGDELGSIALNPFTRRLYWIAGSTSEIKTRSYDPDGEVTTLATSTSRPRALYCDSAKKRLYWTSDGSIDGISLDGTDQKSHVTTDDRNNQALVVYKELFFWISEATTTYINSANTIYNTHDERLNVDMQMVDIVVMDASTQQPTQGVCFENGGCEHYCVPKSSGGRECRCELGYTLQSDGQKCGTVMEVAGEHLLVRDRVTKKLYQVDLTTGNIHAKFSVKDSVDALATNPENTLIYWSDIDGNRILSSNFSGSDVTTVFNIGTERALSAAVGPVSGNIYYTAQSHNNLFGNGYVAVLSPDGRKRKILVSEGQHVPKSIHLHSAKGLMFWAETQFKKMIWRANMDGSDPSSIISAEVKGFTGVTINTGAPPIGIAVDTEADRLYWFDGARDFIQKCSLTGESCKAIVTDPGAGITSLVVVGDKLYYTASNRGGITEVQKADGKGQRFLVASAMIGKLQDLLVVTPNKRSSVQNECSDNNGDCSAFCLPTSNGKTCTCEDGGTCHAQGGSSKLSHKEAVLLASFSLVAASALLGVF